MPTGIPRRKEATTEVFKSLEKVVSDNVRLATAIIMAHMGMSMAQLFAMSAAQAAKK